MSAASEEKAPNPAAAPSPAGGGSKLVLIISIINSLATIGMLVVLFLSFQKEKKRPSVEDIAGRVNAEAEGEKPKEKAEEGKGGEHGEHGEHGESKGSSKKKGTEFGKMVSLDQFTVNLSTPGSVNPKFIRVNISLEVPNDDTENEVNSKMPQIRNVIIDLCNSKRPADLANADGRDYLKEEIKNALNSFLVSGKVKGVFFTSFALAG